MTANSYQPVRLNVEKAIQEAKTSPGFNEAWDALEEEYSTLQALLAARAEAGLTQEDIAKRMGTTKSAVSRLEASLRDPKHSPSFLTLKKYANACGKKIIIQLV